MLSPSVYLDAVSRESARFRAVLTDCDPAARVPACPEWTAADLVSHLTGVQWFWEQVLRRRPAPPPEDPMEGRPARPASYEELLAAFDAQSASFVSVLSSASPEEPAWHWLPASLHTVGSSYRRQAHEALIHRLDAEQTAGAVSPLDASLAADGVEEALDWMYGGEPPAEAGFVAAGGLVEVVLSDTGGTVLAEPGRLTAGKWAGGPHLVVRPSAAGGAPAATVRGTAADVDAWLWHRVPDSAVSFSGSPEVLAAFREAVSPPLD